MPRSEDQDTVDFDLGCESASRFFGSPLKPVSATFGAVSDRGKVRVTNEDHYAVIRRNRSRQVLLTNLPPGSLPPSDESAYVIVVADGVGGAAFGDLASKLALQTAWDLGGKETSWPLNVNEREAEQIAEKFEAYGQLIHRAILDFGRDEPGVVGMGTTLTAAYTVGDVAFFAHIGDSRAYLYRQGAIHQVTRDHTLAQELIDAGIAESDVAKFGNILTNVLGGKGDSVVTDVHQYRLVDGDCLLLCTDGLTDLVQDEDIAGVLGAGGTPQRQCQTLVDLALERGGKDNVTVVIGHYVIPTSEVSNV